MPYNDTGNCAGTPPRGGRIQTVSIDEKPNMYAEDVLWSTYRGNEFDADRGILETETYEALDKAMSCLSKRDKRIVEMTAEEFKPSEISEELGLDSSLVSSRLCRSRKVIRPRIPTELYCSGRKKGRSNSVIMGITYESHVAVSGNPGLSLSVFHYIC